MNFDTTHKGRALVYVFALIAAGGSFAVTQGPVLLKRGLTFTPRIVFGTIAPLIVVVVALGRLFGSETLVTDEITLTHLAVAAVWAVYLIAGLALLSAGFTGWVVLVNVAVAVGAGLIFGYLYSRR
jgi:hypothetical protein